MMNTFTLAGPYMPPHALPGGRVKVVVRGMDGNEVMTWVPRVVEVAMVGWR
jgi:hypothetical protein